MGERLIVRRSAAISHGEVCSGDAVFFNPAVLGPETVLVVPLSHQVTYDNFDSSDVEFVKCSKILFSYMVKALCLRNSQRMTKPM